jgi:hypothetical protein
MLEIFHSVELPRMLHGCEDKTPEPGRSANARTLYAVY